jgi:hypothetical protein
MKLKYKFEAQYKITNTFTVTESAESMADFMTRFDVIVDKGYTQCVASGNPVVEWCRVVNPSASEADKALWNATEDTKVMGILAAEGIVPPLPKPLFPMNVAADVKLNTLVTEGMEDILSDAGKRLMASMGPGVGKTSKPTERQQIWVAMVETKYGTNVYPSVTEAGMVAQVAEYCRQYWNVKDMGPVPNDAGRLIHEYFHEHDTEFYSHDEYPLGR